MPYCGYREYDFDAPTLSGADCYDRFLLRVAEMHESLKIIRRCRDMLAAEPGPVMVLDKKVGWPAQLPVGADCTGDSLVHIWHIMGESMQALIHHVKLIIEGFSAPPDQAYAGEGPRGELGAHVVSTGGTRPWWVHPRDLSFVNLQAIPALCEGGMVAVVVACVASIDPVLGGVDR